MKTVTATEAKRRFGQLIERAKMGEAIQITKRGRPVAVLRQGSVQMAPAGVLRRVAAQVKQFMRRQPPSLASARDTLSAIRYRD